MISRTDFHAAGIINFIIDQDARLSDAVQPTEMGCAAFFFRRILDVLSSFITDEISDFNSSVYYTNPDYLRCSYLEGKMLA